jgi:hypothetical protein
VTSIERQANADAALIIAMRNALPALLAELRALRAVAEAAAVFRRVEELVDSTPRNHNLKIADALGEKIAARTALIEALAALDATKGGGS